MSDDLEALALALDEADLDHADDVDRLGAMSAAEVDYLAALGEEPDPLSDGIEPRCSRL